jgi:hypothetical protein
MESSGPAFPPPVPSGPAGTARPAAPAGLAAPAGPQPAIRVGDRERDAVAHRLQDAFAEGRLDDDEFDQRMRAALTARMSTELDVLTADLPAAPHRAVPARPGTAGPKPGRLAVAYKGSVRRSGRWRVPARFTSVIYKGSARLDLRAAELTAPVTTMIAIAYKSHIELLVPLGVRVELEGFGVSKAWSAEEDMERLVPADAPVLQVRGVAYKGTIEVSTRPASPDPATR